VGRAVAAAAGDDRAGGLPAPDPAAGGRPAARRPPGPAGADPADGHRAPLGRQPGKSDPIDALAVAQAALREPDLPVAHLDGPTRQVKLLCDYRADLVVERTMLCNRLRWHLHELDADWDPPARPMDRASNLNRISARLAALSGTVARLATAITERCRQLTIEIDALEAEIKELAERLAPTLIALPGCGALTAAKILGETAGVLRFRSTAAYARHNGTVPLPVWSSNRAPHRLSRTGNRQINAAPHRIAMTQARCHPPARDLIARRKADGDGGLEALRILKRRLSDAVYQALRADVITRQTAVA
jgi:transposase